MKNDISNKIVAFGIVAAMLIAALSVIAPVASATPDEITSIVGSLPDGRIASAVACIDGRIYAIGGYNWTLGRADNTTYIYDIATGKTTRGANMTTAVEDPACAVANGQIYIFGGYDGSFVSRNLTQIYDPVANSWHAGKNMSVNGRFDTAATLPDGRIMVVGVSSANSTLIYTPMSNTWEYAADIPNARSAIGLTVWNDTAVYAFGGEDTPPMDTARNYGDVYNPETDAWSTAPANLPGVRGGGAAVTARNGYIYFIGGYTGGYTTIIYRYDTDLNSWALAGDSLTTGRAYFGNAVTDDYGRIFVVGGYNGGALATIEMLIPSDIVAERFVKITSPNDGAYVNGEVRITASTTAIGALVTSTMGSDILIDDVLYRSSTTNSPTILWDTTGLEIGSVHTITIHVFISDGTIIEDSIQVTISSMTTDEMINDLQNQIAKLQQKIAELQQNNSDLQQMVDDLNASSSQSLSDLENQLLALQTQLNNLQTTTGTAKDSASSANMFAMIGMLVAIIVLVLVIINMMMSRTKK